MAAKAIGAQAHLRLRKGSRLLRGGVNARKQVASAAELKPLPGVYFKPGPALPAPANRLNVQGQRFVKHGKIENNRVTNDSRKVFPFVSGAPIF